MALHRQITDAVLTTRPLQRTRLSKAALAVLMTMAGVVAMQYYVAVGVAPAGPVHLWTALSLGGIGVFFALIRSGWSRRLEDPGMTLAQILFALCSGASAYALAGEGRGGAFPIMMVVVAFGLFQLRPREFMAVGLFAVGLFGVVMAAMAHLQPAVYRPAVELGHFLMFATMTPAMALLASRFSTLRQRLRQQKHELAEALGRIQELATRDELTGLVNRRHMQTLLEQAHRRCVRSGQRFCLALVDVDHFKVVNDNHGHAAGDEVLRALAQEMPLALRLSDTLSRWGGEEFVLMLSDTQLPMAREGLERLRQRVARLRVKVPAGELHISVSAGLAEHRPGESAEDTLARADAALLEAKQQGRNRVVLAA